MTPQKIEALRLALPTMSMHEKVKVLSLLEEWGRREDAKKARNSLLTFVKRINPAYKIGPHHKILAHKLEAAARGELDRLATAIAPRFGKSLLLSLYFPAWFMGNFPEQKLIISSHTADLAVDFGKKVRNLLDTKEYKEIFPGVTLASDSKSAGRWNTSKGGEFFAVGVGGAVAGRGADLCVSPETVVFTTRGKLRAKDVVVGDFLLGSDGFGKVMHCIKSSHLGTTYIDNLSASALHPIWTANRGWIPAEKILFLDVLQTVPFWAIVGSFLTFWSRYVFRLFSGERCSFTAESPQKYKTREFLRTHLQHLGNDAAALFKSASAKLHKLWRKGDIGRPTMGQVCSVFGGYGASTDTNAHVGQDKCSWKLHETELSMGYGRRAAKQSAQCGSADRFWQNHDNETVEPGTWDQVRCAAASNSYNGAISGRSCSHAKGQLHTAARRLLFFAREKAYRLLGVSRSYGEGYRIGQKNSTPLFGWAQQVGQRVFLGLRNPRRIQHTVHDAKEFVNFHVDGHNTFVADSFLTHNCIIDDPFSEQDILNGNYSVFDKVYEWYAYGMRTRLMPGGRVVVLHTRWAKNDLIGQLLDESAKNKDADQWEYIEFPAILNEGTEVEKSLWPEQWSLEALRRTRASMPTFQWQAQYQQSPTSQQGALIKKEWWRRWTKEDPPECEYIIMSLDAAQEVNKRSDFTALTTWGVFYLDADDGARTAAIILLNAINKRMEFPALKDLALKEYKAWQPDCFIIEKKSNGAPLSQELRRMGIPIQDYTPSRGAPGNANTKYARVNSIADIVRSGLVWAPDYKWAEEVIEQCNDFPSGKNDDLVDTVTQALMRFRSGGFIVLPSDEDFDTPRFVPKRSAAYY